MLNTSIYRKKSHGNGLWLFFVMVLPAVALLLACDRPTPLPLASETTAAVDTLHDSLSLIRPLAVDSTMTITNYASQMDADTAFLRGHALAATTCRSRLSLYQSEGKAKDWEILCPVEEQWSLVACGSLRARRVKDLKGLTVASARDDASRLLLDKMLREAGVNPSDVYHPQINSLSLRAQMLTNDQVDAAMLTSPYDTLARARGHRIICTLTDTTQTVLIVRRSATADQRRQVRRLLGL